MSRRRLFMVAALLASCSSHPAQAPTTPTTPSSPKATQMLASLRHPVSALRDQTSAVIPVGGQPHAPDWQVVGFGSVWVSNEPLNLVQRIDPGSNAVMASIRVNVPCDGLGAGYGSIWVPDCQDGLIARIDPSSDRVIAKIPTSIAGAQNGGEGLIGVGAGGVWVMTAPDLLSEIDPSTNKVTKNVPIAIGSFAVAVGFGSVWATNSDQDLVTRVDPGGGVIATIPVGVTPLFLATGQGGVWVLNQGDGSVSHIDPTTNQVVATIGARSPGEGGCIAAGEHAVWVSIPGAPLTRIDPTTDEVTAQYVGVGGDCLSAGFGSVWLSNHELGNVWRIKTSMGGKA